MENEQLKEEKCAKSRELTKSQRSARRSLLNASHREINSSRVDVALEIMGLWYADAYEEFRTLSPNAKERKVLEFMPSDELNIEQQVQAVKMLGWNVQEVIGSPNSFKVYVILEK
jgi:hypothetical protein